MSAEVLADDGNYELRFENGRYVAGCHTFTRAQAIAHWTDRRKSACCEMALPNCDCVKVAKQRARLFLKAIKAHKPAQPSPQQVYRDYVESVATEPGAER